MKTHKLNDFTIGFQEVPSMTSGVKINDDCLYCDINYGLGNELISLPSTGFELFSTDSREVTEEQAREVMPCAMGQHYYKHPESNGSDRWVKTALESYNSMKVMLSVIDVNPMPKLEYCCSGSAQMECGCMGYPINYDEEGLEQYDKAKSQVKRYVVLIKKN